MTDTVRSAALEEAAKMCEGLQVSPKPGRYETRSVEIANGALKVAAEYIRKLKDCPPHSERGKEMKDARFTPVYDAAGMRCPNGTPCYDRRCSDDDCCTKAQSEMEAAHGVCSPRPEGKK